MIEAWPGEPRQPEKKPVASPLGTTSHDEGKNGPPQSQRDKRRAETLGRYKRWYESSQEIKKERKTSKQSHKPSELARLVANRLPKIKGKPGVEADTVLRRLNQDYPGWAD